MGAPMEISVARWVVWSKMGAQIPSLQEAQSNGPTSNGRAVPALSPQTLECYKYHGWGHISQKCPSNQNYTREGLPQEANFNSLMGQQNQALPERTTYLSTPSNNRSSA